MIIYSSPDDKKKNRGFCFLEYESHKAASLAKRRLGTGRIKVCHLAISLNSIQFNSGVWAWKWITKFIPNNKVWGCDIIVDWADPQEEPDESTMSKVKVLYVRNLTQDISEEKLKESFEQYGKVERVKKIKDYAFVHFEDRDHAVLAMRGLDGKELGCANIEVIVYEIHLKSPQSLSPTENYWPFPFDFPRPNFKQVSLAKPPSDKKKKEEVLRARERRMLLMMQGRTGVVGLVKHPSVHNHKAMHINCFSLSIRVCLLLFPIHFCFPFVEACHLLTLVWYHHLDYRQWEA